ncbi:RsmB/NOP family class I SAM-dependent RNA methyltransferase [Paraburkholderia caballeronis]|uniref:16S rRNA (Cytosine967-C5)-methyltransferase n=1 Tax=Paraburkholderia caballeronis TaxID=416943 RepID=A0A1H7PJD5_9BURK|nr:RsmB/NOP family class I SAM-dependent RNA methyltransferase [Paraburkholderia caballeronis]PXW24199.1 16S rRNA (cytosine967-C5)-methyltransferase [Paraburkholderia caballeronis]PXW99980.1 16S rRNA (cytosine967-C5)-methyltransferase [Paraburkholderia caballeronis]RAJ97110.1 16S rRNA (cytosine967-C5)-methyltransferase [Paraburkholderia caballeronis]TDV35273.1 16S rRNA (cytosine967-C5)-methyltransferase [Paraburkholderia caballeronis]SEB74630.1 16S rRNA (cytosine967-C5)-methyltransferase [Para
MRLHGFLIGQTETLLADVLKFTGPADAVTSRFFRAHPKLGHSERGVIAEAVFAVLRRRMEFAHLAESGSGSPARRLALLGLMQTAGRSAVRPFVSDAEAGWLEHVSKIDPASLPLRVQMNLPDWILRALETRFEPAELAQLAAALNYPAPLDLRANPIKASRDELLKSLAAAGIDAAPTTFAPYGVRIDGKPALSKLDAFTNGWFEVQDEGSQLLCSLVAPRRGEMIADFCAGAGGKTLALGAAMRSTGRLYAFDVSERRLAKLKPRLARSGLSNVNPVLIDSEHDAKIKRLAGKLDRVLVDAPCSGLGTLRRNPDLKWRQTPDSVAELAPKQLSILTSAARLVKRGGRLVYATCSILEAENEAVVKQFLDAHPEFVLVSARDVLAEQRIDLDTGEYLSLWPHRHATDGFFAAVLERRGDAKPSAEQTEAAALPDALADAPAEPGQ